MKKCLIFLIFGWLQLNGMLYVTAELDSAAVASIFAHERWKAQPEYRIKEDLAEGLSNVLTQLTGAFGCIASMKFSRGLPLGEHLDGCEDQEEMIEKCYRALSVLFDKEGADPNCIIPPDDTMMPLDFAYVTIDDGFREKRVLNSRLYDFLRSVGATKRLQGTVK